MPERLAACEAAEGYPEAPELATLASSLVGLLLGFVWLVLLDYYYTNS